MSAEMTSMQRVLATMEHREPDRVPFLLATTMHGARVLGMSIEDYYSHAENVIEGQTRLHERYRGDFVIASPYACIEPEAWGATTIFLPDGPPQCGRPVIGSAAAIENLKAPDIESAKCLQRVLDTVRGLRQRFGDEVPVASVVISPFSLPIMQMGFAAYLDLIHDEPERFWQLMAINEEFTVAWANAQLQAGAAAIAYYDPMSSTTNVPRELYLRTGHVIASRVLPRIHGTTLTHFASGRCMEVVDDVIATGTAAIGVGVLEPLEDYKRKSAGQITLVGNLNGVVMRNWTTADAEHAVKCAIAAAGRGGGFVLSDGHGEIPWQVPEVVLDAISAAVRRWGSYPLDWTEDERDALVGPKSWHDSAS